MSIFPQNVKEVEKIVEQINNSFLELEKIGVPVRLNDETPNTLVLYYNDEYGKIFVDKALSQEGNI